MRQSACLVFNPMTVNNFASLFNCTPVGRASDNDGPDIKLFILVGLGRSFFVCCLAHRGSTVGFLLLQCSILHVPQTALCCFKNTKGKYVFLGQFAMQNRNLRRKSSRISSPPVLDRIKDCAA